MRLSYSTRGWQRLSWDEQIEAALDADFEGIEVYDLFKRTDLVKRGGPFDKYNAVTTARQLREALDAFVDSTQQTVNGTVKLKLYKGNIITAGITSPDTLYDEEVATFDEDNVYNQADSAGFINLFGLPIKVKAKLDQKRGK